jgi:hypothetical protein
MVRMLYAYSDIMIHTLFSLAPAPTKPISAVFLVDGIWSSTNGGCLTSFSIDNGCVRIHALTMIGERVRDMRMMERALEEHAKTLRGAQATKDCKVVFLADLGYGGLLTVDMLFATVKRVMTSSECRTMHVTADWQTKANVMLRGLLESNTTCGLCPGHLISANVLQRSRDTMASIRAASRWDWFSEFAVAVYSAFKVSMYFFND